MKREIIKTGDGSATIFLPEWNEHYHSKHGAIQEANHVFLKMGLEHYVERHQARQLDILEIGFGTGLNALITFLDSRRRKVSISYTGVEAYPVTPEELRELRYDALFEEENASEIFQELHRTNWGEKQLIQDDFWLQKKKMFFKEIDSEEDFDLIFFDAFGPRVQPDLWTEDIFCKMFEALRVKGVLVTYSAKGSVRRAMKTAGFEVERLPGPPGKREMLRGTKLKTPVKPL